jgi:hypothetical protein
MIELEERIIALVAKATGTKRERIHLASRLSQDFGMDGDDAVEFFEKFGTQFDVDLTALFDHWDLHFMPEGGGPGLGGTFAIGAGLLAGAILHEAVKWIPLWAAMLTLAGLSLWVCIKIFGEPPDEKAPVTVNDLVEAAGSGQWVKRYEAPAAPLFRSGG